MDKHLVLNFLYEHLLKAIGEALDGHRSIENKNIDFNYQYISAIEMIRLLKREIKKFEGEHYAKQ